MDDFAKLPPKDRADLFQAAARLRHMLPAVIEKDFWVCWTLKRLFTLPSPPTGLLFKGGTSLSKVYHVIDRFSEDVDLSFDRHGLGFQGASDPLELKGKARQRALEALTATCRRTIRERFLPQMIEAFSQALGEAPSTHWTIQVATDDPDAQTLLFRFPRSLVPGANEPAYIAPLVRLELGARSDHWPAIDGIVSSYLAEAYPQFIKAPTAAVHTLAIERTFWEKATLLHMWHHAPPTKPLRDRQSRHYYDLFQLYRRGPGQAALKDTALLAGVARHKKVFFAAAWAKYPDAKPGTLRLVPPTARLPELQDDYALMQQMIFGTVPEFAEILAALREMEGLINA
jgi:hypothetical protein